MELLQYWKMARKWWWLILLTTIICGAFGIFYAKRQVPIYTTTATLIINPAAPSALIPYATDTTVQSLASTYTEFMKTRSFAQLVATQMGDVISADDVLNALSVRFVEGTQIFRVTGTHTDPAVAQAVANKAAEVLIAENIARQRRQQEQMQSKQNNEASQEHNRLVELQQVLQQEADNYNSHIADLEKAIANLENSPRSAETDQRVLELRQELISSRTARVGALGSLAQTQAALSTNANNGTTNVDTAVVIDPAILPNTPQPGQARQLMILAILGGIMAGGGLAWLLEYIDYTVRTPEELDLHYGIPTQGAIGFVTTQNDRQRSGSLVTINEPRSPIAEAFRALRTSVRMANAVRPIHNLLITSSGPGEGKTFITTNLAISLAQEGKRVILVDADLRRPQVHKAFGMATEPGFTNAVADKTLAVEQLLRTTNVPNLRVLTCGTIPPNPSELLGSTRASEIINTLAANADIVLYDTPPAATVTDAVILAPQMDGVLQVVRAGVTRIDLVQRCKVLLARADIHILGPVLNGVQVSDLGYYANYYYYGGYYQGNTEATKEAGNQTASKRSWWPGRRRRKHSPTRQPVETNNTQWTLVNETSAPTSQNGAKPQRTYSSSNNFPPESA